METKIPLSAREQEVLRLLATGATNKEIANQLVISPNTVKVHLRNIYAKIEVGSRTEASMWAVQHGLLPMLSEAAPAVEPPQERAQETPQAAPEKSRTWWLAIAVMLLLTLTAAALLGRALLSPSPTAMPSPQVVAGAALTRWQAQPDLPMARWGMIPVVYGSRLYLFGGQDAAGAAQDGYLLRIADDQWERLPPAPAPLTASCAAILGEKIYLAGGLRSPQEPHPQVQVFDLRQGTWESAAPLPLPLAGCALSAYEGRLYLFGGWDGKTYLDIALRYDPQTERWESLPPLDTPLAYASAVSTETGIHLLGGRNGQGVLTRHAFYSPARAEAAWQALPDVPASGAQIQATDIAGLLHAFVLDAESTQVWTFVASENAWHQAERPPRPLGLDVAIAPAEAFIHVLGGRQGGQALSQHWMYQAIFITSIPVIIQ